MLTIVTPANGFPVSLQEVKDQVLQGLDVDDAYLGQIVIPAAVHRAETETGRALLTQTWDVLFDGWPCGSVLELPKPPLTSVTHVKYRDTTGTLQTWATTNYVTEAPSGPNAGPGRLALAFGASWPSLYGQIGDVQVRIVCGYGSAGDVPPMLRLALLLDCAAIYANREQPVFSTDPMYFQFRAHSGQRRVA